MGRCNGVFLTGRVPRLARQNVTEHSRRSDLTMLLLCFSTSVDCFRRQTWRNQNDKICMLFLKILNSYTNCIKITSVETPKIF